MAHQRGLALLAVLAACGLPRPVEPEVRAREVIVVQALLSTESSTQTIWIERSFSIEPRSSLDSTLGGGGPPSPPPSLVEVRDTLGGVFVFAQDMATPARYVATFIPVNGRRYALRITTDTQILTASVVVPLPVTLLEPATDTVILATYDSLHATWTSGSSRHFGWAITPTAPALWDEPESPFFNAQLRDSTHSVLWMESQGTRLFWVLAFDPQSWGYFYPQGTYEEEPLASNVTGGAGIFGAVTGDRVVVRVP